MTPTNASLRAKITELESIVAQLRIANETLLSNNVKLAEQLKAAKDAEAGIARQRSALAADYAKLQQEKESCKVKCERAVAEKDNIIQNQQVKINNMKSLSDIKWTADVEQGVVVIRGRLP